MFNGPNWRTPLLIPAVLASLFLDYYPLKNSLHSDSTIVVSEPSRAVLSSSLSLFSRFLNEKAESNCWGWNRFGATAVWNLAFSRNQNAFWFSTRCRECADQIQLFVCILSSMNKSDGSASARAWIFAGRRCDPIWHANLFLRPFVLQ